MPQALISLRTNSSISLQQRVSTKVQFLYVLELWKKWHAYIAGLQAYTLYTDPMLNF